MFAHVTSAVSCSDEMFRMTNAKSSLRHVFTYAWSASRVWCKRESFWCRVCGNTENVCSRRRCRDKDKRINIYFHLICRRTFLFVWKHLFIKLTASSFLLIAFEQSPCNTHAHHQPFSLSFCKQLHFEAHNSSSFRSYQDICEASSLLHVNFQLENDTPSCKCCPA